MRFLRTASTARLLAVIAALIAIAGGGAAIAVAATSGGPVPPPKRLAGAVHAALTAPHVTGVSADIRFTNGLIDSSDFAGQQGTDPLLQGATGRLWLSDDGRMRLELQSDDGDAQVVVHHDRFWISDPMSHTTYEGTLPRAHEHRDAPAGRGADHVPSVAEIQSAITRLMRRVGVSGAQPTDVAGRAAYRVEITPKSTGGLLGSVGLAWDAARGVPLSLTVTPTGATKPVLALTATHISYGSVPDSTLDVSPPAGNRVVTLPSFGGGASTGGSSGGWLGFRLRAPRQLAGRSRHSVRYANWNAFLSYGTGPGAISVIESPAKSGAKDSTTGSGMLQLPTVSIDGATGPELSTQLGTVLRLTRGDVAYTLLGSVPKATLEAAARDLLAADG